MSDQQWLRFSFLVTSLYLSIWVLFFHCIYRLVCLLIHSHHPNWFIAIYESHSSFLVRIQALSNNTPHPSSYTPKCLPPQIFMYFGLHIYGWVIKIGSEIVRFWDFRFIRGWCPLILQQLMSDSLALISTGIAENSHYFKQILFKEEFDFRMSAVTISH